jgi:CheY-like chemotaxis protein
VLALPASQAHILTRRRIRLGGSVEQILIADDDAAIRALTRTMIEGVGYRTLQARDGAEAIERVRQDRPDLVLLDLKMPKVDGWGVLEFVHTLARPPQVIVVTGMHEVVPPGHLSHFVAGYLIKPFDRDALLRACEKALKPPVEAFDGDRRDGRRTFIVDTTLLSETGTPLAIGQVVELSPHGFRVQLKVPVERGDGVRVAFLLPGRPELVSFAGRVRWKEEVAIGAEIDDLSPEDAKVLSELLALDRRAESKLEN